MEMIHELSRWKNQEKIRVSFFLRLNTFIFFLQLFHHDNVMIKLLFLCTDEIWSKHLSIDFLKRKKYILETTENGDFEWSPFCFAAIKSATSATLIVSCSFLRVQWFL